MRYKLTNEQIEQLRAWILHHDAAMYEVAAMYKTAADFASCELGFGVTTQRMAACARRVRGRSPAMRWRGRDRRLIYAPRAYATRTWRRLKQVLRGRGDLAGKHPAVAAQILLGEGKRFAIPAIGEMMRLLGMSAKEAPR